MSLDDNVMKLEFSGLRDAKLFYSTVRSILTKVGFNPSHVHYFCYGNRRVFVRKNFEGISRLLKDGLKLGGIQFVELFQGYGAAHAKVLTCYDNADDLKNHNFSYYAIASTSNLGSSLPIKTREGIQHVDKRKAAKCDFNDGMITKIGDYHFFTVLSLYETVFNRKLVPQFVIRPNLEFKC